jgi:hypothetical protein
MRQDHPIIIIRIIENKFTSGKNELLSTGEIKLTGLEVTHNRVMRRKDFIKWGFNVSCLPGVVSLKGLKVFHHIYRMQDLSTHCISIGSSPS